MSLFDSIAKGALEQLTKGSGQGNSALLGAAAQLINSPEIGGLAGLAKLFAQQGQGAAMNSWIGSGQNAPISPESILAVLGNDRIQQLAGSAGLSAGDVQQGLAGVLPQLVDQLTPDGKLPSDRGADDLLGQLARQFLGR
jgi:uncharacterized protein YidB (DUF937 family)